MGGALEARGVPAGDGRLQSEAEGEVEVEDGVLIIKRIHVKHRLKVDADADRDAIDRMYDMHVSKCPVAQTFKGCIDISTELELEEE